MSKRHQERPKSDAMEFLEEVMGGPLTFGGLLSAIRLGEKELLEKFATRSGRGSWAIWMRSLPSSRFRPR